MSIKIVYIYDYLRQDCSKQSQHANADTQA